jgi:DNA-binding NarL/FixJ family response regulator
MKRLLIVADRSMVVHSIRLALRQTAGFEVVGFVDGRAPVRDALVEHRPDVVLVDELEDAVLALARLREATEHAPDAQLVLLTMRMEDGWLADVFEAGADAVLSKTMHPVSLGTTLREVVRGNVVHRYESPRRTTTEACPLTRRELEILLLAAEGHTNGQIARSLWVTEQTVKFHLSNTYRKLGVANRTEASRYAHLHELVEPRERLAS